MSVQTTNILFGSEAEVTLIKITYYLIVFASIMLCFTF